MVTSHHYEMSPSIFIWTHKQTGEMHLRNILKKTMLVKSLSLQQTAPTFSEGKPAQTSKQQKKENNGSKVVETKPNRSIYSA